ncbi:hypothetical protein BC831DRAFT_473393 [Entophlyctis helioformis]|nr:hypothetical protein BC831DRAFT_473393 [Entophlyctis helioformis]
MLQPERRIAARQGIGVGVQQYQIRVQIGLGRLVAQARLDERVSCHGASVRSIRSEQRVERVGCQRHASADHVVPDALGRLGLLQPPMALHERREHGRGQHRRAAVSGALLLCAHDDDVHEKVEVVHDDRVGRAGGRRRLVADDQTEESNELLDREGGQVVGRQQQLELGERSRVVGLDQRANEHAARPLDVEREVGWADGGRRRECALRLLALERPGRVHVLSALLLLLLPAGRLDADGPPGHRRHFRRLQPCSGHGRRRRLLRPAVHQRRQRPMRQRCVGGGLRGDMRRPRQQPHKAAHRCCCRRSRCHGRRR